jgi:hypothetical protein
MNPIDIINLNNEFGEPIIQCNICKNISGTLISEFTHNFTCKYHRNYTIKDKDKDVILVDTVNRHFIFPVYQKEYYIATPENPIIGTYSLTSCICIIMREPILNITMLAHIDLTTINPLQTFFEVFDNYDKVNVYMMGGNSSSIDQCNTLINAFDNKDTYDIKYVHLIDYGKNSIAIDSRTGELYVNKDISYYQDIPLRLSVEETVQYGKLKLVTF